MLIIGHRGAPGLAPENTLPSFEKAIEHKVAMVEFDVRLTKDKQMIIIHDWHTKRVALTTKLIRRLTLQQVRKLAMREGEPIPTFEELLTHLDHRVPIDIEIKSYGAAKYIMPVVRRLLSEGYTYDEIIISSFLHGELRAVRRQDKQIRLLLLKRRYPFAFIPFVKSLNLYAIGVKNELTTPALVRAAHKRGVLIGVYTINTVEKALRFADMGVDILFTDHAYIFSTPEWQKKLEAVKGHAKV